MNEPDDFSSLFAPEPVTPAAESPSAFWKVLLVDDEPDIHAVLRLAAQDMVVDGRGLLLLDAQSGAEARAKLAEHPDIALILLDVVMESGGAGLDLVRYIRNELGNRTIQIVLVTGQPGYAPQREVITEYKIDGYRLKSELSTEKIFVSVFAALRTHQALLELADKNRQLQTHIAELNKSRETERASNHAKDVAEAANQAKSAFLAKMSHEILTPINGILGMTHLIAQSGLNDKQAAQIDKVRRSGLHLLHIVNNLLDLSNMEAGKLAIESRSFSVSDLVQSITDILSTRLLDTKRVVEISFKTLPKQLLGDDNRLRQILLNYLDNALKFSQEGRVTLSAEIEEETESDLRIRFAVSDSGLGIPVDQQARLFQHFEQADNSTARKYGGSGIGLAINKKLAELMGGSVGVSSQPNQGSTFWLSLRLGRVKNSLETGLTVTNTDPEEILKRQHRGTRLLLAEDDPTNQAVSIELLQDVGLLIDLAVDGEQAVNMSANGNYALILMDMQMPGMDGVEATRRIRARPDGRAIPIIAMTANAYAEDRTRCFEAGMNDFIAKPINPETVFATLLKWLPAPRASVPDSAPLPAMAPAAEADPNAELIHRLSAVPGLDVARGISVVRGKTAKYIELLAQFVVSHADDMDRLAESIAAGDHAKTLLLAHSLKGAAATLGIVSVAEAARHIEQQEREQKGDSLDFQTDMNTVRHELEVIGAALPSVHSSVTRPVDARSVDSPIHEKLLAELDERLANDDFSAIGIFQQHGETLRNALGYQYDEMARQIRQFEFATARETLRAVRVSRTSETDKPSVDQ